MRVKRGRTKSEKRRTYCAGTFRRESGADTPKCICGVQCAGKRDTVRRIAKKKQGTFKKRTSPEDVLFMMSFYAIIILIDSFPSFISCDHALDAFVGIKQVADGSVVV